MKLIKYKKNQKFITKTSTGKINGCLLPIYNINDDFYPFGFEPKQVYLTSILPNSIKGPHLHHIRTGCFTCIRGNIRLIMKINSVYEIYKSGEEYDYLSIMVPTGVPAALQNIGQTEALVLNMPYPAWTQDMNDEHSADFSDFNFNDIN
jgi:hypothetical protein